MKKKLICALLALCIAATLAAFASSAEEHGHFYVDGVCECGERIEEKAAFALPGRAGTCTPLRASVTLPEGWAPTEKPINMFSIRLINAPVVLIAPTEFGSCERLTTIISAAL